MLHENAKQRLKRVVPEEFSVDWYDPQRDERVEETFDLDHNRQVRWARQGSAIEYPCVYLDIDPQGSPRGDIGHIFSDGVYKEEVPHDDDVAYIKYTAAPQRAILRVTACVKHGTDTIPKRVIADDLAIETWHAFRFNTRHLLEEGVDPSGQDLTGAWPLRLVPNTRGMEDTSGSLDEQHIERRQFEFSVEYAYFDEEEVEQLKEIEYRFGLDMDHDGEVDEWGPWRVVD